MLGTLEAATENDINLFILEPVLTLKAQIRKQMSDWSDTAYIVVINTDGISK